jgi:hypothetical protein
MIEFLFGVCVGLLLVLTPAAQWFNKRLNELLDSIKK